MDLPEKGIVVDMASIKERAIRGEPWILLDSIEGSLADFTAAVDAADRDAQARYGNETISSQGPDGHSLPVGFVIALYWADDGEELERWVQVLAHNLESRGFTGTLSGADSAYPPHDNAPITPTLTAVLSWTVQMPARPQPDRRPEQVWGVDPDTARRIAAFSNDWLSHAQGEPLLGVRGFWTRGPVEDIGYWLTRGVTESGNASIEMISIAEQVTARAVLADGGIGLFQAPGEPGWHQQVERLREWLLAVPDHTDHGFIRPCAQRPVSIMDIDRPLPLPGISEAHIRYNKHLAASYLPDAHGVQIVTDNHLERIGTLNPAQWHVQPLDAGRYLVQARDLAPWYSTPLPDPDTLEQARTDFAGALLTIDATIADPPPWLTPYQHRLRREHYESTLP